MHARITTMTGATRIDEGVEHLRTEVVPQLQQQKGYRGLSANVDRAAGIVSVLTLWETEADLDASESAGEKFRKEAADAFDGHNQTVERYEQTVAESGPTPPTSASRLQIRRIRMEPALVEDNLAFFRSTVLPEIMATSGCLAVRQMIDRTSGEGAVGTVWADGTSMKAATARSDERRATAATRGVQFGEVLERELLFTAW
jgi:heme-degrading monooxygenase HmoA